ncbi:MAG: S-adenosyl-L-methionine-dependent methyltransferase [Ilumatobacteraceae bacterium]|nr:S-adenosyl-L-methionine-dependent methyltransferase [Ilumatobacteraceae bacterium]
MQGRASRTAVLVCQGRAVAHGRLAVGRFDDPTALAMLRDDERVAVELAHAGQPPKGFGPRMQFEMLQANAEVVAPRTVAIDDAVRARPASQVVVLGAGLDGRAWRMTELSAAAVFEVDHPASQQDKRSRLGEMHAVAADVHFVPVDFDCDSLDDALAVAGHSDSVATTWIWEGVVPYLTTGQVEATLQVVTGRSGPSSRLIVNYQAPSAKASIGRLLARALAVVGRRDDPLKDEPRRSAWTPTAMRDLLTRAGWTVQSDDDLLTISESLGMTVRRPASLRLGRVAIADR